MAIESKDLLAEAQSRYAEQLKGKANWDALISVYTAQVQALQDATIAVLTCVSIDDSEGDQLDGLGRLLKEPRNGREDTAYRTRLHARVGVVISQGTTEDVLGLLAILTEDIASVRELFPASFIADVGQTQEPGEIAPLVKEARGVAIGGALEYSRTLADDALTWADGDDEPINLFPANVRNGTEDGTSDGFTTGGGFSGSSSADEAHSGARSVKWDTPQTDQWIEAAAEARGIAELTEYVGSVWVDLTQGTNPSYTMRIELITNVGIVATQPFHPKGFLGSWQRVEVRGTTQAGTTEVRLRITSNNDFDLDVAYLDDWQLEYFVDDRKNLLPENARNGGEDGTLTGYATGGGATVVASINQHKDGTSSVKMTTPQVGHYVEATTADAILAGVSYAVSVWIYPVLTGTYELSMISDVGTIATQSFPGLIAGAFQLLTLVGTTQAGATSLKMRARATTNFADDVYLDDWQIEEDAAATAWEGGDAHDWVDPGGSTTEADTRRGWADDAWSDESPTGAVIRAVAHDGSTLYVHVGSGGLIRSSPDGITWTVRVSGTAENLFGVAFGGGLWVAVGNAGTLRTSADGIAWADHDVGGEDLRAVAYGDGTWMAVGDAGQAWRSSDGAIWSGTTMSGEDLLAIAWGADTWIVVGTTGLVLRSLDAAATWSTRATGTTETLRGVAFGLATWVVVGDTATILRSINDGGAWSAIVSAELTTKDLNAVRHNGRGVFQLAGEDGTVSGSVDGEHWVAIDVGAIADDQRGVAADHLNTWLTVGDAGTVVREYDGGAWIGVLEA